MVELSELAAEVARRTRAVAPALAEHVVRTALTPMPVGSGELLIKEEHLQRSGSFKIRGATAKVLAVDADARSRGLIAASSGNHGLGMAHALTSIGGKGTVYVPEGASAVKVAAIRRLGVEVQHRGRAAGESELLARAHAEEAGLVYVSPYNDVDVMAGQGTIGLELLEQAGVDGLDAVVVAVGGGGLISGIAATIKAAAPHVRIIGAMPANDAAMAASVAAGQVVDVDARPTLSDATAGAVEPGALTLPLCVELVDEWVLVEEAEIGAALRLFIDTQHQLVEGAAAVAIAAALRDVPTDGRRVAVVSCGANISAETLRVALTK
ncbi:pyridoxal-phosphate dependent enzyme [Pseudonocardia sp. TRM90224]|uniref:pyridoxal-phosphate dependent enzyme n=1 Tax=Pseudonocardia sp. TRM90224 TaxID=2812678 RepID=UPI001E331EB5|nr:pyridoxal-phosphate dependent enzyme [Pseudonocardia sp. TRM90224]